MSSSRNSRVKMAPRKRTETKRKCVELGTLIVRRASQIRTGGPPPGGFFSSMTAAFDVSSKWSPCRIMKNVFSLSFCRGTTPVDSPLTVGLKTGMCADSRRV
jgi:hypothetical protein